MKKIRPELTDDQKKKALELFELGYGAPKIAQMIGAYNSPTSTFLKHNTKPRTREEMLALRLKNNINFTAGPRGL